jgi:putative alpha-1,2-mannosidase
VTPTERAAIFRFTFPENEQSWIILDAFHKGSRVMIIPEEQKIIGYARNNSGGVPENFANYFVAIFDKPFEEFGTFKGNLNELGSLEAEGRHTGAFVRFKTTDGEIVHVKVASSFISPNRLS